MHKMKLAVAVRKDLEMGKGKIAAQVGHASVLASEYARVNTPDLWKEWLSEGQFKAVLKVNSESDLYVLEAAAKAANLPTHIVRDLGYTQVAPDSATCIAIGPAAVGEIDKITRHLPLL